MRLYIDLDTRGFIESETFPRPVTSLALKRGDNVPVDLYFVHGGAIQELAEGATGRIGLKPKGQFGSAFYLALDADWEKTGAAETTRYAFSLNLATTEIESAFLAEPPSVLAMLEIEWVESGLRTSSATLDVELQNDVNRGNEGVPQDATPPYPLPNIILTSANTPPATQEEAEAAIEASWALQTNGAAEGVRRFLGEPTLAAALQALGFLGEPGAAGKQVLHRTSTTDILSYLGAIALRKVVLAADLVATGSPVNVISSVNTSGSCLFFGYAAVAKGDPAYTGHVINLKGVNTSGWHHLLRATWHVPTLNGGVPQPDGSAPEIKLIGYGPGGWDLQPSTTPAAGHLVVLYFGFIRNAGSIWMELWNSSTENPATVKAGAFLAAIPL